MEALGRPVTTAQPGTPCGWTAYGETGTKLTCKGGKDAVHILTKTLPVAQAGTALCAFHSPWDPTEEERAVVGQPLQTMGKAPKLKAVHAADLGTGDDKTTACGKAQVHGRVTMVPGSVTCKLCKGTRRFERWTLSVAWRLKEAEFARAGLRREMVIREVGGAGRFGVIARIESGGIEIYFWTPDQAGKTYRAFSTAAAFDEACEITDLTKMIKVGDRLVSALGGESVVLGVTSTSVRYRQTGIATPVDVTASEFAAEISRGWLAIVPTTQCRACHKAISNTQDHKHFDRPMSWPGMPERPKGLYIRPDGTREAVTTDDMAQVGMRVNYGYGFADNGTVVEVTWHLIVVKRDKDGTTYTLSLRDLLRLINRGNVSTFMPDAKGRPIGSWR